jgi:hypothetical protein
VTTLLVGLRPGRALPPSTASRSGSERASGAPQLRPVRPVTPVSAGSPAGPSRTSPPNATADVISAVTVGTGTSEVP